MQHDAMTFRNVSAGYKLQKVLDNISFTVREGEIGLCAYSYMKFVHLDSAFPW